MGCFGYICNGCGQSINGGEKAVLKHIRHGKVLGQTKGAYNMYGGVDGDDVYRAMGNDYTNSHEEICKSEISLPDSPLYSAKLFRDQETEWMAFRSIRTGEGVEDQSHELYDEWDALPDYPKAAVRSGTEAWHLCCYEKATPKERTLHRISESDPNQSFGNPRTEFL